MTAAAVVSALCAAFDWFFVVQSFVDESTAAAGHLPQFVVRTVCFGQARIFALFSHRRMTRRLTFKRAGNVPHAQNAATSFMPRARRWREPMPTNMGRLMGVVVSNFPSRATVFRGSRT
jgi:hypothetical protein